MIAQVGSVLLFLVWPQAGADSQQKFTISEESGQTDKRKNHRFKWNGIGRDQLYKSKLLISKTGRISNTLETVIVWIVKTYAITKMVSCVRTIEGPRHKNIKAYSISNKPGQLPYLTLPDLFGQQLLGRKKSLRDVHAMPASQGESI